MLLAIDVGNSTTSVGLFAPDRELKFLAALDTGVRRTADQFSIDLMNVFALEMRSLVFQEHQKKYHVLIFAPHGLGEKKAAHRQPSYLVSSLTPEQRSVYNTPSL